MTNYDLCVHVDQNDPALLGLALNNIANYMAALPDEKFRVRLVANGPAVQMFKQGVTPHDARVAELASKGVTFALCANAIKAFSVDKDALISGCEVVPAGVVELVHLQREGFAYIKP